MAAVLLALVIVDSTGRRKLLLGGGSLMGVFMLILGGLGTSNPDTLAQSAKGAMVASLMLFQFFFNLSWAPMPTYQPAVLKIEMLTCPPAPTSSSPKLLIRASRRRPIWQYPADPTAHANDQLTVLLQLAIVVSVLTTFVTSFTVPYLINPEYANLGGKLGYIYGAINLIMVAGVFFFIPELKNRSLEEVNQLFASGAPLRKFGGIQTQQAVQMYGRGVEEKRRESVETREVVAGREDV